MIAADTSSLAAYFEGETGADISVLDAALADGSLLVPPVVLTELLSDPRQPRQLQSLLADVEVLSLTEGFWERAGENRRKLKAMGLRAKIADALIAQGCIDHNVPLITRDADFRHFAKHCGLKLA